MTIGGRSEPGGSLVGSMVAHYRITGRLGAGAMGEVFRARDTRLERDVAIKLLPAAVSENRDRLARFAREAQVLAQLHHPHIASIFGLEEGHGGRALVMELVEGPTLDERLKMGPLPLEDAVSIARQIAEALEAAHGRGIIHRDLKPANIKAPVDGKTKVLDFGLAKALAPATGEGSPSLAFDATLTSAGSADGVVLGSAAYMAPEQARGRPVDKRADIWAFGCILWEMLVGRRLFDGETLSDTLAAVLTRNVDWGALPAAAPQPLRELLRRLLERDLRSRLHDIADARIVLEEVASGSAAAGALDAGAGRASTSAPSRRRAALPWLLLALVGVPALFVLGRDVIRPARPAGPAVRFVVAPPPDTRLAGLEQPALDLSRDGRRLVFVVANRAGVRRLCVRELGEVEARELPGTDDAREPFFSPDGRSVAFFARGELRRVAVDGGVPITLATVENPRGGAWVDEATIVLPTAPDGGLMRLPSRGGQPEPLTTLEEQRHERSHRWPSPFPGGVLFVSDTFESADFYDDARIEAATLDGRRRAVVVERSSFARYLPSGHLIFARGGSLYAARFDARRLQVIGEPALVRQHVSTMVTTGAVQFAATESLLAHIPGGLLSESRSVVWSGRDGAERPLTVDRAREVLLVNLSPDDRRLAVVSTAAPTADLWIIDLARSTANRLTFHGNSWDPVWSPDGRSIAYASARDGKRFLPYLNATDGGGEERLLWESEGASFPSSFSSDGRFLALEVRPPNAGSDVWILSLDGATEPYPFLATRAIEWQPVFSPAGRFLAYTANESGTNEVYVRPFPGPGGPWQVSRGGGQEPKWSPDGRRIYFRSERALFEVDVDTSRGFAAGPPRQIRGGLVPTPNNNSFDVTTDGQRFVLLRASEDEPGLGVTVALDWPEELRSRLRR